MTRHFCTLFDSRYLVKAVAMHRSMLATGADFHLTAFCFDEPVERLLGRLELPRLDTVPLAELERFDPELLAVKEDRTEVEYCWTSTPALPLYLLDARPEIDEVTYIDADLLFFADPEPLFEEMGGASVLITPHRFAPEHGHQEKHGIYNVQFLTFRRTEDGLECLRWWHDRCIEWCYYRLEDGKLGDQKYLDDWPTRFSGIHSLDHKGGGLAPWNISQYELSDDGGAITVDDDPLVFFHYHRVKQFEDGSVDWRPPGYPIEADERSVVYDPYIDALQAALAEVRAIDPEFRAGLEPPPPVGERVRHIARRAKGRARQAATGARRLLRD